jgi:hypothetical protein
MSAQLGSVSRADLEMYGSHVAEVALPGSMRRDGELGAAERICR